MPRQHTIRWFLIANFLVLMLMLGHALAGGFSMGAAGIVFSAATAVLYAMLFIAPAAIISLLVSRWLPRLAVVLAVLLASATVIALYADFRVYDLYGFHFNGFVWNLLTTPGGVESMGGSDQSELSVALLMGGIVLVEAVLYGVIALLLGRVMVPGRKRYLVAVFFALLCGVQLSYAFGRILAWQPVLVTARDVPLFIPISVRSFASLIGVHAKRTAHNKISTSGVLDYPLHPIQTVKDAPSPNILWLVSESLRADMLTPEIMPNLWKFAQDAHRFTNHYSGGNGTRMGVFSLFYGLPGNYWFPFLDVRRSPVIMDELQRRHYQLGIYASSKLTYPEFDKTVFVNVPGNKLHVDTQVSWKADRHNVKELLGFMDKARSTDKPWLAYMFFNSPHARYYFPPESVIRPNYLKEFNYAQTDSKEVRRDIVKIKNRYINSVHHLDQQLGRVFAYVREHQLKKDTIIIITGDHGEEFMDVSRWGHNSELHDAQIHVPMVLWIPGKGHGVHDYPTSHLDMASTLMPLLGVTNPPGDYTVGHNLLKPVANRYRLATNWNSLAYIGKDYKVCMPLRAGGMSDTAVTTADDKPVANSGKVLAGLQGRLVHVLQDMSRFYAKH
ncbi:MAG: sulfatase-like hydrolase/transferase [Alcanivorax sp.]|nr:sulfatase-like hydrolase/transferase [Alcanivorax sp.]